MKFKHFYVPNNLLTLRALVDVSVPPTEARMMLGKVFEIQYANPTAQVAVDGTHWDTYAIEGGNLENYPDYGVHCWSVPLEAVELRP